MATLFPAVTRKMAVLTINKTGAVLPYRKNVVYDVYFIRDSPAPPPRYLDK